MVKLNEVGHPYLNFLFLIICVFLVCTMIAQATIVSSAHNFSSSGWSGGEICIACHTPHNADTTVAGASLWNHEVTTAIYTLYDSPTMDAIPNQPGGVSRLCLSCHDSTIALDSFGHNSGSNYISGTADLDTNLSDDHPISIDWDHSTVLPAGGSKCANCHNVHTTPSFISVLPFFSGRVECPTCHDPHNKVPEVKMLRKSLAGSDICLHCHNK